MNFINRFREQSRNVLFINLTTMTQQYNGYTNQATYIANLHLQNTEKHYNTIQTKTSKLDENLLSEWIKFYTENVMIKDQSFKKDLDNNSIKDINFKELAEDFILNK